MANNKKMEVFVNLTKGDTVVAIEEKVLPGSLVFDSLNPFPGYYQIKKDTSHATIGVLGALAFPLYTRFHTLLSGYMRHRYSVVCPVLHIRTFSSYMRRCQ